MRRQCGIERGRLLCAMPVTRELVLSSIAGAVGVGVAAFGVILVGKRLFGCKSSGVKSEGSKVYETRLLVDQYVAFHYCHPEEYMVYDFGPHEALDFPRRCAELCLQYKPDDVVSRALDIGCAVGRSTFELAREYEEVVGIDFSVAFIKECQLLKRSGQASYSLSVEGDLAENKIATVDPTIDRKRTSFMVGDACNLPYLGKFGCVFAGNLICRLPEPGNFYSRLPDLIEPGGLLFITSPYCWLESYTEKTKWLGGYKSGTEEMRGFSTLKKILEPNFDLVVEQDMPFLIRETVRRHQWTVAQATIWMRKK